MIETDDRENILISLQIVDVYLGVDDVLLMNRHYYYWWYYLDIPAESKRGGVVFVIDKISGGSSG